jgi:DNA-binding beta-propeller fold protein YncE
VITLKRTATGNKKDTLKSHKSHYSINGEIGMEHRKILVTALLVILFAACSKKQDAPNILIRPKVLAVDSANSRLFVADSEDKHLYLINTSDNTVTSDEALVTEATFVELPQLPQDLAVTSLGNKISRLFLIGSGNVPRNKIFILDYDTSGLHLASISPIEIEPNTVNNLQGVLTGLAVDPVQQIVFVADAINSQVHGYDFISGLEVADSPWLVGPSPSKIAIDSISRQLIVSSLGSSEVSVINLDDLAATPLSLEVGIKTASVAQATNAVGTVLFALSPITNEIRVFQWDRQDANSITLIGNPIVAPNLGSGEATTELLSGAASQITAGVLADGTIAAFATQSTGDLGYIDLGTNLLSFTDGRTAVINGQGASDIDLLYNTDGQATGVYFAAPGGSAVNLVNPVNHQFVIEVL